MLRVDHVMGLHRAFWIPAGFAATEGMYVRYPAAEFYAIFNLESHRHQTQIIGENLGTVPVYVNDAMARHKIFGMHVGEFAVETNPEQALQPPPHQAVASLDTDDTATFMGFWSGAEIDDRVALGLVDAAQAEREHRYRVAQRAALIAFLHAQGDLPPTVDEPEAVLHAWLVFLARQDQDFLLINLEDLWLESISAERAGHLARTPQLAAQSPAIARRAARALGNTRVFEDDQRQAESDEVNIYGATTRFHPSHRRRRLFI